MLEEGVELKMVIKLSKKAKYYLAKNGMYIGISYFSSHCHKCEKGFFFLFIPKKSATIPCKMLEEGVKLVENGHKNEQKSQILLGKNSMYIMTFELYIQYAPS